MSAPKLQRGTERTLAVFVAAFLGFYLSLQGAVAQWVSCHGPDGVEIRALGVFSSATSRPVLFAGTWGKGIFRSTDRGSIWSAATDASPGARYNAIAAGDSEVYAGTDGGLFRSTDLGASWTLLAVDLPVCRVNALLLDGSRIFAGTDSGVFRSSDHGSAWERRSPDTSVSRILALAGNDSVLFAGTDSAGVFKSTDGGIHWISSSAGLSTGLVTALAIGGGKIFAGNGRSIYMADSSGALWTGVGPSPDSGRVYSFAFPAGFSQAPEILVGWFGTVGDWQILGVGRSTDGGTTWRPFGVVTGDALLMQPSAYTLLAVPGIAGGTDYLAGTSAGVFVRRQGDTTWTRSNKGLAHSTVPAMASDGNDLLVMNDVGSFYSHDQGATWEPAGFHWGPYPHGTAALAMNDLDIFYSGYGGVMRLERLTKQDDPGSDGLPEGRVEALALVEDAAGGPLIFAGTGTGVYRSVNYGRFWRPVGAGLPDSSIAALSVVDSTVYVATRRGVIAAVAARDTVWVQAGRWARASFDSVRSLAALHGGRGHVIVLGTDSGVFSAPAGELSAPWTDVGRGLGDSTVCALVVQGQSLFAGTNTRGVWRRPLTEILTHAQAAPAMLPTVVQLFQNFPNPFNPTTRIRFFVPTRSHVVVTVFNTLGQQVARLLDGAANAGTHDLLFDGGRLASGMYICRLQTAGVSLSKRLLLVR